jgi:hypothetical protein
VIATIEKYAIKTQLQNCPLKKIIKKNPMVKKRHFLSHNFKFFFLGISLRKIFFENLKAYIIIYFIIFIFFCAEAAKVLTTMGILYVKLMRGKVFLGPSPGIIRDVPSTGCHQNLTKPFLHV